MTTVTVSANEIHAQGHADHRDVCLFIEASFQIAARTVLSMDASATAALSVETPAFVITYGEDGLAPIAALQSVLDELAQRYPAHLSIVRRDAAEIA